jgi:hypothetical protein
MKTPNSNGPNDNVHARFLEKQWEELMALNAECDLFRIYPLRGTPPYVYLARYRCKGLAKTLSGKIVVHDSWDVGIQIPPHYLRAPLHPSEVLTFVGTGETHGLAPFHPNISNKCICMTITPGMPITEIVYGLFELLTWQLYSTRDEGLNHEAAQYARSQPADRFPIDTRSLKRPPDRPLNIEEINPEP